MLGVMRTHSRRTLIVAGSVAVIGIAVATSFFWSSGGGSLTAKELHFDRQKLGGAADGVSVPSTNVVADFFRSRYSAAQRAEFHVTSSQSIAIFVRATGVQIRTASGWQPFSRRTEKRNLATEARNCTRIVCRAARKSSRGDMASVRSLWRGDARTAVVEGAVTRGLEDSQFHQLDRQRLGRWPIQR